MNNGTSNDKLLADAEAASRVWKANPELKLKDLDFQTYENLRQGFQTAVNRVTGLEAEISREIHNRDNMAEELNAMNIRLRSAARGYFGPDSSEYEELGGTRASDRRRPTRRQAEPAAK